MPPTPPPQVPTTAGSEGPADADAGADAGANASRDDLVAGGSGGDGRRAWSARSRWPVWGWAALAGVALAAGVVGPLVGRGWLLVLDWVQGPRSHLGGAYWGKGVPPGPVPAAVVGLGHLLGGQAVSWLVVAAIFPLAAAGAARLTPAGAAGRLAAGVLYAVNPFVFDRVGAGQVYVLLGYALLPFAVASLLRSESRRGVGRLAAGAWWAALVAASVHYAFIAGVVVVAVVVWRHRPRTLWWAAQTLAVTAVLDAWLAVPTLVGVSPGVAVGATDLAAFRTSSDPVWGLYVNVAGLYGFWRRVLVEPKAFLPAWPALAAALLAVAAIGLVAAWRAGQRELVGVLVLSAVAGYLLALGAQGPTGGVFRLLYDDFPAFRVMREPEKFLALLALAEAAGFGLGAEELARRLARAPAKWACLAVAAALPLAYTPTIFAGLDGQIAPSRYPPAWAAANRLMGAGRGSILFLPWQQYLAFGFTHGAVIADPAPGYFERPVLASDDVGAGSLGDDSTSDRAGFIQTVLDDGTRLHRLGALLAPLGVRYVVLAQTADFRSYAWVATQSDLTEVFDRGGLEVWRVPGALVEGARLRSSLEVASVAAYIALAQRVDLAGTAVFVDPHRRDAHSPADPVPAAAPAGPGGEGAGGVGSGARPGPVLDVTRLSPVAYRVGAGPPGWVVLPEAWSPEWALDGRPGRPLADGLVAFPAGAHAARVRFGGWPVALAGDAVSLVAAVGLAAAGVAGRLRRRARRAWPARRG